MTIPLARPNSTERNKAKEAMRVVPADVWDLERSIGSPRNASQVRTLDSANRKSAPMDSGGGSVPRGERSTDLHREKASAAIMGALFGIALIVGSAFGGAFSSGDGGAVPREANQPVAAAVH